MKISSSYILCKSTVEKMMKLLSNEEDVENNTNLQIVTLRIDNTYDTNLTKNMNMNNKRDMSNLIPFFSYFFKNEDPDLNLNGKTISLNDFLKNYKVAHLNINRNKNMSLNENNTLSIDLYKIGNNPVTIPSSIFENSNKNKNELNKYPSFEKKLKELFANKNNVSINNISIFPGSISCLEVIFDIFIPKRYQFINMYPGWDIINIIADKYNIDNMDLSLKEDYSVDYNKILLKINGLTNLIYLTNPSFPIGKLLDKDKFIKFMNLLKKDIIVVVDECYMDYISNNIESSVVDLIDKYDNLIVLKTVSKFYGLASIRIGYCISNENITKILNNYNINKHIDKYKYDLIDKVINNKEYKESVLNYNNSIKNKIYKYLDVKKINYIKSETNFMLIETDKNLIEIDKQLIKNKIEPYQTYLYYDKYFLFYVDKEEINNKILEIII